MKVRKKIVGPVSEANAQCTWTDKNWAVLNSYCLSRCTATQLTPNNWAGIRSLLLSFLAPT